MMNTRSRVLALARRSDPAAAGTLLAAYERKFRLRGDHAAAGYWHVGHVGYAESAARHYEDAAAMRLAARPEPRPGDVVNYHGSLTHLHAPLVVVEVPDYDGLLTATHPDGYNLSRIRPTSVTPTGRRVAVCTTCGHEPRWRNDSGRCCADGCRCKALTR